MPSKYSRRLGRRGVLGAKRGNANFYKGTGARTEGNHTTKGAYVIRPERTMTIVAPDLTGCQLKPYVAARATPQGKRVPDWEAILKNNTNGAGSKETELR